MSKLTAQQAAVKIRSSIKKEKVDPKGMVSVSSNDYVSEVRVDLRRLSQESRENVCRVIDAIDGNFIMDVM